MAAPHVTGTWASIKQALLEDGSTASVTDILTALQTTGIPVDHPTNGLTFPRIQVDQALDILVTDRVFNDFNSNEQSELLGYNTGSGEIGQLFIENAVITLNGTTLESENPAFSIDLARNWSLVNTGHYNSDTSADYLLVNTVSGNVRIVLLNNGAFVSQHDLFTLDLPAGWTLLSRKP